MERRKPEQIDQTLRLFLRESGLETPLRQFRVVQDWPSIVGPQIAPHTTALKVENQTLLVRVHAPTLRTQLNLMKANLIGQINAAAQAHLIFDIKFV
ncbi:MAG: DUF721 domain-containing protein [Bacteroidaceae bacterium]|nr:DUF721 domain-containing protein [Bacteroidaceae bacterium]